LSLAINPQTAQRIDDYLAAAGHGDDADGPLFRPLRHNQRLNVARRRLHPVAIDRILRKYAANVGLGGGYSAHSMRATFITTALNNGASLEDVQRDVGHADPGTTKLYDRRGHNPERSASFFATY
jgi:integrase